MGSLGDGVKKVLLAGIGTVAVTAEKSKEAVSYTHLDVYKRQVCI